MHTHVLLSFDLKQNTTSEARKVFDETLECWGWRDCPAVASTKIKMFTVGGNITDANAYAYMEVYEATINAKVKEVSCVIHCGDSEPLQRTFLQGSVS